MSRRVLHGAAFVVVVAALLVVGVSIVAEAVGGVLAGTFVCVLYGFALGAIADGYFTHVIMRPARPRPKRIPAREGYWTEAEASKFWADLERTLRGER